MFTLPDSDALEAMPAYELHKMVLGSPEYAVLSRLQSCTLSLQIVYANYEELSKFLQYWSIPANADQLAYIRTRHLLDQFQRQLARLLFNYVSSTMALADHTRVVYRELNVPRANFEDYEQEVRTRFFENPLARFIDGLRQYTFHYRSPPVGTAFTWAGGQEFSAVHNLSVQDLKEFGGWPGPAKQYLATQGEHVNLDRCLSDYHEQVNNFQKWFEGRQREIFKPELDALEVVNRHLVRKNLLSEIAGALNPANPAPDLSSLFFHVVSLDQWRQLSKSPIDSDERVDLLINFLSKTIALDEDLKQSIRRCFIPRASRAN